MDILGIAFRAALLNEEIESAANNAPFPMLIIEYSKKDSNQSFSHMPHCFSCSSRWHFQSSVDFYIPH